MASPVGYLYRVGQSRSRRLRRRVGRGRLEARALDDVVIVDPALERALATLPERQRVAVVLAHGYGWPHAEVAALLGVSTSTVATHVARGLERLRSIMEVDVDA
jgi:RNA polymerase sigma-70 factor (ECF subfamily)